MAGMLPHRIQLESVLSVIAKLYSGVLEQKDFNTIAIDIIVG